MPNMANGIATRVNRFGIGAWLAALPAHNRGGVEQKGSPLELYERPDNLFVAGFIGSPKMNFITGPMAAQHGATRVGVRPEHLLIDRSGGELTGTAGVSEHPGSDTFIHVRLDDGQSLTARAPGEFRLNHGERIGLTPEGGRIHRFDSTEILLRE